MAPTIKHPVIPEGELHCIWMEAGLTDYKLCDKNYLCEECSFDSEIRKAQSDNDSSPVLRQMFAPKKQRESFDNILHIQANTPPAGNQSANEYFLRLCDEEARTILKQALPNDRTYFRNHTWLKFETSSVLLMGIDHVGAHFLRQMVSIVLPETPTQIERNSPFVWVVFGEGTIGLRSGIRGTVIETNGELLDHPLRLTNDPYNSGWILKISAPVDEEQMKHLHGKNLTALRAELAGIKSNLMISLQREQSHARTEYDGGKPLRTIHEIVGDKRYFEIVNSFLSRNT